MSNLSNWNGSQTQLGHRSAPANVSRNAIPTLPSLGFSRSHHARTVSRDSHLGRHDSWDKGHQHQKEVLRRHLAADAKANARRRSYGNLVVSLFVLMACLMAGYSLHAEQRQQEQLIERLR